MAAKKDKDFVRNIAKERTYQNQDEAYDEAYFKWCADESNPFSFNFVQDEREHSYMAGQGFIKHGADTAEQATLHNCLRLLGGVMLVMLLFDVINYLLMLYINDGMSCNAIYYSKRAFTGDSAAAACLIYSAVNIIKYAAAIFIYSAKSKLPRNVALPAGRSTGSFRFNAVVIMMMIVVTGKIANSFLSRILGLVNIDSIFVYMFNNIELSVQVVSLIYNCAVLPILCEIFFRGLVLQSFRQFGDAFAVVVSAIACGVAFYDFSYIGYAMLCSVVIGVFTVRSGSIGTAIVMHSATTTINYLLSMVSMANSSTGLILSAAIYLVICASSLVVYSRLNRSKSWSFNIDRGESELSLSKKIELMLSSTTLAIWFVSAIVMTILTMRFLQ